MRIDYAVRQHEQWYKGDGTYGDGPDFQRWVCLRRTTSWLAHHWVGRRKEYGQGKTCQQITRCDGIISLLPVPEVEFLGEELHYTSLQALADQIAVVSACVNLKHMRDVSFGKSIGELLTRFYYV